MYDSDGIGDVEFGKDLPTVWDNTRVIEAEPGEFVAVARLSGNALWGRVVTNERPRSNVPISLAFLRRDGGSGSYDAWIHEDADSHTITKRTVIVTR